MLVAVRAANGRVRTCERPQGSRSRPDAAHGEAWSASARSGPAACGGGVARQRAGSAPAGWLPHDSCAPCRSPTKTVEALRVSLAQVYLVVFLAQVYRVVSLAQVYLVRCPQPPLRGSR